MFFLLSSLLGSSSTILETSFKINPCQIYARFVVFCTKPCGEIQVEPWFEEPFAFILSLNHQQLGTTNATAQQYVVQVRLHDESTHPLVAS